jgi:hypothetical protein
MRVVIVAETIQLNSSSSTVERVRIRSIRNVWAASNTLAHAEQVWRANPTFALTVKYGWGFGM